VSLNPTRSLRGRLVLFLVSATLLSHLLFAGLVPSVLLRIYREQLVLERTKQTATVALSHYRRVGSWQGFVFPGRGALPPEATSTRRTLDAVQPPLLLDTRGNVVAHGPGAAPERVNLVDVHPHPVWVNGRIVGYVVPGSPPPDTPEERAVVTAMTRSIVLAAASRAVVIVLLVILLTRSVLGALERLTVAAREFTLGRPYVPVPVRGRDEVAILTETFNGMQGEIAQADTQRRQMLADIAHDLSTPLTIVHGYVQAMENGRLSPTPERLATLREELDLMRNLVEDLRFLSLADAGEVRLNRENVLPGEVLEAVHRAFGQRAERQGVTLSLYVAPDLPEVSLDQARMRQALGNLVANALNHTARGGRVWLEAVSTEGALEFRVRDTGSGIPADDLPLVFRRFYRGDQERSGTGTGLGLNITRSIAQLHDGEILLDSTEGVGTQVKVRIGLD